MSKINQSKIDKILSRREVSLVAKTDTTEHWQALSQTDINKSYIVEFKNQLEQGMFSCECPSFKYDEVNDPQTCKHIEAVKILKLNEEEKKHALTKDVGERDKVASPSASGEL